MAIVGLIVALVLLLVGTAFYDSQTGEQTADNANVDSIHNASLDVGVGGAASVSATARAGQPRPYRPL